MKMDAFTSRKFWGSLAIVWFMLFVSMAIATFSFEFTHALGIAADEDTHFITACSPVDAGNFSDPLTSGDHFVLTTKSATTTAHPDENDSDFQDTLVTGSLQPIDSHGAFIKDIPPSRNNLTLTVNTCAILIE